MHRKTSKNRFGLATPEWCVILGCLTVAIIAIVSNLPPSLEGNLRGTAAYIGFEEPELQFTLHDWEVAVGDQLDLGTVIGSGSFNGVTLKGDPQFVIPFLSGQMVTVTAAMAQDGDYGRGNYRIIAQDREGKELDDITIRIK